MITLTSYPKVTFVNFKNEEEINRYLEDKGGKGPHPLFKYAQWDNVKQMLADRYLWMSNPSKWDDSFEQYFLNANYSDSKANEISFPFINNVFCCCLTPDNNSEAHWNTYSKNKIGVCLKINVKELVEKLNNFGVANQDYKIYIGKISYKKLTDIQKDNIKDIPLYEESLGESINKDINNPNFCANLLLLKRDSFKHDNEIRIIFIKYKNKYMNEINGIQFQYNYDNNGCSISNYDNGLLINRIITSPHFDDVARDGIRVELKKKRYCFNDYPVNYKPGKVYYRSRILRSKLYDNIKSPKIKI